MKLRKIYLLAFWILGFALSSHAQQDPQFTQYMHTQMIYNPAFVGTGDMINGSLFYRKQWQSFENSPTTQNFNVNAPIKRKNIGVGLHVLNDQLGITGSLSALGSFAYHLRLKGAVLSMGLNAGFKQNRLYGEKLDARDNGDPIFSNSTLNNIAPDIGFGLVYRSKIYYIGLSSLHLNNASIKYRDSSTAKMSRHYYLTAGYTYEINQKMTITPSLLMSFAESSALQNNFSTNFSLQWTYMEMFWAGTSYRSNDASSLFIGFNVGKINPEAFKEQIKFGYAYDWSNGRLPKYNEGSHEIFIAYDIPLKAKRQMPKFK